MTEGTSSQGRRAPVAVLADTQAAVSELIEQLSPTGLECAGGLIGEPGLVGLLEDRPAVIVVGASSPSSDVRAVLGRARAGGIAAITILSEATQTAIEALLGDGAVDVLLGPAPWALLRAKVRSYAELSAARGASPEAQRDLRAEVVERSRLLALEADVGVALAMSESLSTCLDACARALVHHVDAAFARIWTLADAGTVLELEASAGMYTHLDGDHGRVPVGKFKIGMIAEQRAPHLTNQVIGDPRVGNQAWAEREGMVGFAGYPLLVGEKLVGVVGLFTRHALGEATFGALGAVANSIAQGIERARVQQRLQVSQEWLLTTLRSIGDGVIATDPRGCVTFLNPVAAELTGWTADDAAGKPLDEVFRIFHEETRAVVESPVTKVLREGTIVGLANHTLLVRRDGIETPIDDSAAPIRDAQGQLTGVVLVFHDAGEKRRADAERAVLLEREQLARTEAELARSRLFRFLMDAPALICVLRGPHHVIELANPLYRQLIGGRDVIGMPVREALPEIEGQGLLEMLDSVIASGEPFVGTEVAADIRRDGSGALQRGYFNFVYQPMRDAGGRVDGILVHAVEVTEQVTSRQALETAFEVQRETNRRMSALVAEVTEQAREMTVAVRDMREARDRAEQRLAEHEQRAKAGV